MPPGPPKSRSPRPAVRSLLTRSDFAFAGADGRWRWEGSAASAEMDEATGVSLLSGVEATYFSKGEATLRLRAQEGRLDRKQEMALLKGKVAGASLVTGARLTAAEVELDLKRSRLEARGKVKIETQAGVLSGESFSGDIGLKKVWGGPAGEGPPPREGEK